MLFQDSVLMLVITFHHIRPAKTASCRSKQSAAAAAALGRWCGVVDARSIGDERWPWCIGGCCCYRQIISTSYVIEAALAAAAAAWALSSLHLARHLRESGLLWPAMRKIPNNSARVHYSNTHTNIASTTAVLASLHRSHDIRKANFAIK